MMPSTCLIGAWWLEQPLPILVIGAVLMSVAAMAWVKTRDSRAALALLGTVLLTVAGLALEHWVVTPGEQVADTLQALARQLERNEPEGVLPYLAAGNPELRQEALQRLKWVHVDSVSIKSNLEVTVGSGQPPRTAEAKFNAVASVKDKKGYGGDFTVPRYFVVQFVLEDGQWRVMRYEMLDPMGSGRNRLQF